MTLISQQIIQSEYLIKFSDPKCHTSPQQQWLNNKLLSQMINKSLTGL